jgi:hypothetical protein
MHGKRSRAEPLTAQKVDFLPVEAATARQRFDPCR